jgi:hypothetical protein
MPSAPTSFKVLAFDGPPGKPRSVTAALPMTPRWDVKSRTVTGVSLGRANGVCGTHG